MPVSQALLTFCRKKLKSDACTGIGFFYESRSALKLAQNFAPTPNAIEGLDSLLDERSRFIPTLSGSTPPLEVSDQI